MKREIKFRGKSKLGLKPWVKGFFMEDEVERRFISWKPDNDNFQLTPVDYESVGQFTGLKDKNGKEIYEGDIIRWDDNSNRQRWRVAVVELNPDIQFRIITIKCDFIQSAREDYVFNFGSFAYKDTENHIEVIGNIHENPELL